MTMAEALLKEGEEKGHAHGLKEGLEKGRQEGRGEGIKSVARTMLKEGFTATVIQRTTGLTVEEIQTLQTGEISDAEPQQD